MRDQRCIIISRYLERQYLLGFDVVGHSLAIQHAAGDGVLEQTGQPPEDVGVLAANDKYATMSKIP